MLVRIKLFHFDVAEEIFVDAEDPSFVINFVKNKGIQSALENCLEKHSGYIGIFEVANELKKILQNNGFKVIEPIEFVGKVGIIIRKREDLSRKFHVEEDTLRKIAEHNEKIDEKLVGEIECQGNTSSK